MANVLAEAGPAPPLARPPLSPPSTSSSSSNSSSSNPASLSNPASSSNPTRHDPVVVRPARMLLVTAASACAHTAIFMLTPWRPVEPYLTKERVTSLVHAFVSSGVAAAWIASTRLERWNAPSQLLSGVAGTADAWGAPLCAFSTGYFIQDLIAMLLYRDELWDVGSVIHHIIGILSFGSGSLTGVGNPMQIMFLFEEFSTIFMNLRKLYQGSPRLQTFYTLAFAVTFIGVRMVWGMYAYIASLRIYWAHRKDVLPTAKLEGQFLIHVAVATVSRVLNSYWSALILRRLFIVLTGKGKSELSGKKN